MKQFASIPDKPSVVRVTPATAVDWLENRNLETNRRLSEHIALKYARVIKSGSWLVTHQGIAFDRDGFLIDGQHRLRAVVLAGQAVDMFVVPNCDPDTFAVLDNGFKRQAAHLIRAPFAHVVAHAARYLYVVADDRRRAGGAVYETALTTAEVIKIVDEWPELTELAPVTESCYKAIKITRGIHLAVLAQAARTRHAHRIEEWADGLRSGVSMESSDPRLALRNRWIRDSRALNGAHGRGAAYRLIARAWNAYAEDRQLGNLQAAENRPAPAITNH